MALFSAPGGLGLSPVLGPTGDGTSNANSSNAESSPAPPGFSSQQDMPSIPAIGGDMGGTARHSNSSSNSSSSVASSAPGGPAGGPGSRHSSFDGQSPSMPISMIGGQQPTAIPFAPPNRSSQFAPSGRLQRGSFGGLGSSMMGGMAGSGSMSWSAQQHDPTSRQHDVERQQQFFQQQQQIQHEIRMQQEQIQQLQAQLQSQMQQMMLQSSSGGGDGAGMGGSSERNTQQMQQQQQRILQTQMQLQQMQSFPVGSGMMNPQLAMQQQDNFFASAQQQREQHQHQRQQQQRQQHTYQQKPQQQQIHGQQQRAPSASQTKTAQPASQSALSNSGAENGGKPTQPTPVAVGAAVIGKSVTASAAKKPAASGGWASIVASNRPSVPPPKTLGKGKTQSIHRKPQVGSVSSSRIQQSLRQKQAPQQLNKRGGGAGTSVSSAGGSRGGRGSGGVGSGSGGKGKERFVIKTDTITKGKEKRTTLMIQNIPNKYTRQMLVDELNDKHRHCYDFLYLPIDFRNKCNLGYAFINMITPADVVSLHNNMRGQSWKQSRSEKKADVKWGRLQGKRSLVEHFRASSFLKRIPNDCRPICFYSVGAKKGQVEFYIGGSGLEE